MERIKMKLICFAVAEGRIHWWIQSLWEGERRSKELDKRDFPGGPVVKNLHCNSGGVGSIPGQGTKVPHTEKQLSSHNATTEPTQCN